MSVMSVVIFHLKRFWDYEEGDVCPKCGQGILKDTGEDTLDCPNPDCKESFHRKVDLSEEIRNGRKTREWRDATPYWFKRLTTANSLDKLVSVTDEDRRENTRIILDNFLKVKRTWLLIGFPKHSIPRFEADIMGLTFYPSTAQLELKFENVKERRKNE